jgi:hypothetical protein
MSSSFLPVEDLQIFCRFCDKITPVQLDRSIAENGRTVDRNSTFEYLCVKCYKTICFSGNDLLEQTKPDVHKETPRAYDPKEHYYIGETISHKKWNDTGLIIGIDRGTPNRIFVNFEKSGLKKLIEDMK